MDQDHGSDWDEARRLAAGWSHAVLEAPAGRDFEDIAHLAAQVCDVPVAIVSVSDAQRNCYRADTGLQMSELPIDASLCTGAALGPGLTIITDTSQDPRFAGSAPLASGFKPRFYAGARLDTPDGYPLGALCILDWEPRSLTDAQRLALTMLGRQVVTQVQLQRLWADHVSLLEASRRTEERQNLLVRELHHRTRNNLAILQALLGATARTSESVAEFYARFSGRITSLARTQMLLSDDYWQTASLHAILANEFERFEGPDVVRIRAMGPNVWLAADLAVPLGMAFHELSVNAAIHGALSVPDGTIAVTWSIRSGGGRRVLELEWRESGGPPYRDDGRSGLGSRMKRTLTLQCEAQVKTIPGDQELLILINVPLIERRLVPEY